jgi:hypothetical protein
MQPEYKRLLRPNALVLLGQGHYALPIEAGSTSNFFTVKNEARALLIERVGDSHHGPNCWLVLSNGERMLAWEDQFKLA